MKSPIASIIGKTTHKKLSDNDDNAVRVIGVKKIASPTPKTVIPTNKNQIPPKIISIIAKNRVIIIRKNIPFEKINISIRLTIAIRKVKLNPTSKMSLAPRNANAK